MLRLLVQVNVYPVLVVEAVVEKERLNVVLLCQEVVQLSQPVLFAHEEETLSVESLLLSNLLLRDRL